VLAVPVAALVCFAAGARPREPQDSLAQDATVTAAVPLAESPLMRAIRGGDGETMTHVLEGGANVNVQDDQWSPLMLASFLGDPVIVNALLARPVNVNAANGHGTTSLMQASSRGHAQVALALLAKGAVVNTIDAGGHTALMFAANNGHSDVVKALLSHGATVSVRNRAGSTAASLAAGNGYGEITELLALPPTPPLPANHDQPLTDPAERQMYTDAASAAWRYIDRYSEPSTGLIDGTAGYAYTTMWDIATGLGALYAGHELSLIDTPGYDRRVRLMLHTLRTLGLFDAAAFNKVYATQTGSMIGLDKRPSTRGYGWSALDLGRLLVWLRILAVNQPQYHDDIAAIVGRLAMGRIVKDGYLQGETLSATGAAMLYQEGRIGYEQYAARGFAAWGFTAARALSWTENGLPVTVMGHNLLADVRGGDRITSDPLILMGLELGWDPEARRLAEALLAAQQTRYEQTGRVTMVAEDAMTEPPYYFYYYSALANGKDFALDVQDPHGVVDAPRWVSAKAAWAWHALLPSAYTAVAIRRVVPARTPAGWASGVYEASGQSTGAMNLNTAGVILAAVLVHTRGGSLLRLTGSEGR
jgi:hypothetical protein